MWRIGRFPNYLMKMNSTCKCSLNSDRTRLKETFLEHSGLPDDLQVVHASKMASSSSDSIGVITPARRQSYYMSRGGKWVNFCKRTANCRAYLLSSYRDFSPPSLTSESKLTDEKNDEMCFEMEGTTWRCVRSKLSSPFI